MIPLSQAARRLGVSRQRLRSAIIEGTVQAERFPRSPLAHGKTVYFLTDEEVDRIEKLFKEYAAKGRDIPRLLQQTIQERLSDLERRVTQLEQDKQS